jgi:nitrate reductase NapE component
VGWETSDSKDRYRHREPRKGKKKEARGRSSGNMFKENSLCFFPVLSITLTHSIHTFIICTIFKFPKPSKYEIFTFLQLILTVQILIDKTHL